jgi:hypothetical protein
MRERTASVVVILTCLCVSTVDGAPPGAAQILASRQTPTDAQGRSEWIPRNEGVSFIDRTRLVLPLCSAPRTEPVRNSRPGATLTRDDG